MSTQIIPVTFDGDALALVDHDGLPFVAMKPVADNMGLNWKSQYDKITEKFGSTMVIIPTVAEDGRQREMVCLPLRKFPAWVYSVNPNKVRPELREKIVRYQEECDDVLWKYWTQGHVERAGVKRATISQQLTAHGVRLKLLKQLKAETDPSLRLAIHAQIDHASRILGIDTPPINAIGFAVTPPTVPPLVDALWDAVERIGLDTLNHSRDPRLIALSLPHFEQECADRKLRAPTAAELRRVMRMSTAPRFIDVRTVNSQLLQRSVKCWVFEAEEHGPA